MALQQLRAPFEDGVLTTSRFDLDEKAGEFARRPFFRRAERRTEFDYGGNRFFERMESVAQRPATCSRWLWWKCLPAGSVRQDRQPAAAPGRRAAFSRRSKAGPSARLRAWLEFGPVRQNRAGRSRPGGEGLHFASHRSARAGPSARLRAGLAFGPVRQDRAGRSLRPAEARYSRPVGPPRACSPQVAARTENRPNRATAILFNFES